MSQKSSLYRTIEILKRLDEGKKLCVSALAVEYEVSDRTIRRDFELIRELFGEFTSKEGECYRAYRKVLLEEVLGARDLMTLANIVNIFGMTSMQSAISDRTEALIKTSMEVYDFKSRPLEDMRNGEMLKRLEHAIKFNKLVKITYRSENGTSQRSFHPYKILFVNENFYLVGENVSINRFEFLRISMVMDVVQTSRVFFPHREFLQFISRIQSPFSTFGKEEITVKLRVNKASRRFFRFKRYLPSQEVVGEFENGDIEVHYRVSNLREVEELLIKWLPNIQVLAPSGLKRMLKKRLQEKLRSLSYPPGRDEKKREKE